MRPADESKVPPPSPAPTPSDAWSERHATFCGIALDALGPGPLIEAIARGVALPRPVLFGHHNLHSLALFDDDPLVFGGFYDLVDASFVDGMSMVAIAKLCGADLRRDDRSTVLDWIWLLFAEAELQGWKVHHVGGDDAVIATATGKLAEHHPELAFTTRNGFFDASNGSPENDEVLAEISAIAPDVLLVGMGMPRQEAWIAANLSEIDASVIVTVGGILGYLGEDRATPPRWIGRLGLEWLARLLDEPARLGRRYLIEPLPLLPTIARGAYHERMASKRW